MTLGAKIWNAMCTTVLLGTIVALVGLAGISFIEEGHRRVEVTDYWSKQPVIIEEGWLPGLHNLFETNFPRVHEIVGVLFHEASSAATAPPEAKATEGLPILDEKKTKEELETLKKSLDKIKADAGKEWTVN